MICVLYGFEHVYEAFVFLLFVLIVSQETKINANPVESFPSAAAGVPLKN